MVIWWLSVDLRVRPKTLILFPQTTPFCEHFNPIIYFIKIKKEYIYIYFWQDKCLLIRHHKLYSNYQSFCNYFKIKTVALHCIRIVFLIYFLKQFTKVNELYKSLFEECIRNNEWNHVRTRWSITPKLFYIRCLAVEESKIFTYISKYVLSKITYTIESTRTNSQQEFDNFL